MRINIDIEKDLAKDMNVVAAWIGVSRKEWIQSIVSIECKRKMIEIGISQAKTKKLCKDTPS